MDESHRDRIKNAIGKYLTKNDPNRERRTNASPEKDLEKLIIPWLKSNGFHCNVVESKATFNPQQQKFISSSVKSGFVDIVGNHQTGVAVFIELKAPGKRSTLRDNQREFLLSKINTGCFAVCVDSVALLEIMWTNFRDHTNRNQLNLRRDYLLAALPKAKPVKDDGPLFDD